MRIERLLLACAATMLLASCANTTIYPEGKNQYSLSTTSSQQGYAEQDAQKKAAEHCAKQGKQLVVLNHKTEYHGMDKSNAAMINLASAVLVGNGGMANSSQDYQVTMKFQCQA